jgi:hypothetical protein
MLLDACYRLIPDFGHGAGKPAARIRDSRSQRRATGFMDRNTTPL